MNGSCYWCELYLSFQVSENAVESFQLFRSRVVLDNTIGAESVNLRARKSEETGQTPALAGRARRHRNDAGNRSIALADEHGLAASEGKRG